VNIDRSLRLRAGVDYVKGRRSKDLIALHHTVGGSAESTFRWWKDDPRRVATAYLIERDGTIYEVFPPEDMAWQFGVKGGDPLERRAIGIELASEGGLTVKNGHAFAFGTQDLGPVAKLEQEMRIEYHDWRGFRCFDSYDADQVAACFVLVDHLCRTFNIPRVMPSPAECRGDADLMKWWKFKGVLHHALLRPDKSDLHPGFPYEALEAMLHSTSEAS